MLKLSPFTALAQETIDGPYVFHQGENITVKSILRLDDMLKPDVRKYPANTTLDVPVAGHPEWAFPVTIRKEHKAPAVTHRAASKLFIVADVEGEFAAGRALLIAAGVMNEQYNWTFGDGHLVIAGDLFDSGKDVLPWLWLLYSLEEKARTAGGDVHVILGNHDIMQLSGDYRYTDAKYFKHAWLMGREMQEMFADDSELGRWLRSKNVMEKIGDVLVMHGGVSPELLETEWALEAINAACRPYYSTPRKQVPDPLQFLFDEHSPFCYRGYFEAPLAEEQLIDNTLVNFGVRRIVVGHMVQEEISALYNGKVIGVAVDHHKGRPQGLFAEGENYYVIDIKGDRKKL